MRNNTTRIVIIGLIAAVILLASTVIGLMISSGGKAPEATPKVVKQSKMAAPAKPTPDPFVSALKSDGPLRLPAEKVFTSTKTVDVGRTFRLIYPETWAALEMNPDGVSDGSDGEVALDQRGGGRVFLRSLTTPARKSLYGNDPVGSWKGQACPGGTPGGVKGPVRFTVAGVAANFYSYPCDGVDNFAWYIHGKVFASAQDGPDEGQAVDEETVQRMINTGHWLS